MVFPDLRNEIINGLYMQASLLKMKYYEVHFFVLINRKTMKQLFKILLKMVLKEHQYDRHHFYHILNEY